MTSFRTAWRARKAKEFPRHIHRPDWLQIPQLTTRFHGCCAPLEGGLRTFMGHEEGGSLRLSRQKTYLALGAVPHWTSYLRNRESLSLGAWGRDQRVNARDLVEGKVSWDRREGGFRLNPFILLGSGSQPESNLGLSNANGSGFRLKMRPLIVFLAPEIQGFKICLLPLLNMYICVDTQLLPPCPCHLVPYSHPKDVLDSPSVISIHQVSEQY